MLGWRVSESERSEAMATKIGFITDVHGNASALRAVLAELAREDDLAHIYGGGDLIGIGPDTNEVLEMLFGLPAFASASGNHEDCILALVVGEEPNSPPGMEEHHQWIAADLDRRYLPQLQALPRFLGPRHGDVELFIAHYHLDAKQKLTGIDPYPSLKKLDAHYAGHPAAAMLTGHHHDGHLFERPGRAYVNPGALGCGLEPVARYAVITFGAESIEVERRVVPYDREPFLRSYHERNVPNRAFILEQVHGHT